MLEREGFAVEVACDGEHPFAELEHRSFDLILSDVRMPDLDGPALLRRLQSERPALVKRLIFITGDTLGLGTGSALDKLGRPVIRSQSRRKKCGALYKQLRPSPTMDIIFCRLVERAKCSHFGGDVLDQHQTW
jgi:hypothetical protein